MMIFRQALCNLILPPWPGGLGLTIIAHHVPRPRQQCPLYVVDVYTPKHHLFLGILRILPSLPVANLTATAYQSLIILLPFFFLSLHVDCFRDWIGLFMSQIILGPQLPAGLSTPYVSPVRRSLQCPFTPHRSSFTSPHVSPVKTRAYGALFSLL